LPLPYTGIPGRERAFEDFGSAIDVIVFFYHNEGFVCSQGHSEKGIHIADRCPCSIITPVDHQELLDLLADVQIRDLLPAA
jgi:hypothetical protein